MKTSELLFRWVPTFLAFPLGGLISRLAIGSASNLAKALGGSLLVGLVVGLAQFVALKKFGVAPSWAIATTLATTIAALANSLIFSYKFDSTSLVGSGLVAGSLVGLAQSLSQTRDARFSVIWTLATAVAWSVAWFITSKVIVDPESQYHIFGSSGALVATLGLSFFLKLVLPITSVSSAT